MEQLVSLSLGSGDCQQGFQSVSAQLWSPESPLPAKFSGSLPPAPQLAMRYERWKSFYQAFYNRLQWRQDSQTGIEFDGIEFEPNPENQVNQVSLNRFRQTCQELQGSLNQWLQSPEFAAIDQRLRLRLDPNASIKFIIETDDRLLRQLPWHLWNLIENCPQAEVAFGAQSYEPVVSTRSPLARTQPKIARILALLGHSQGIDIQQDRALLEQVPNADVCFLSEPDRPTLNQQLWDTQGWDILFFAGHSSSQPCGEASPSAKPGEGQLYLNPDDKLSIEQLRHGLRAAIDRGLKLAIFNSCDGLGLAQALESLNLPQLIVMREPVPDRVAQQFLKNLIQALAEEQAFYPAVRRAREQLQGLENDFPCASWLPTLCQNPAVPSFAWPGSPAADQAEPLAASDRDVQASAAVLGPSPYQGLASFEQGDGDRYFGRFDAVQTLWEKLQQLHDLPNAIRLLPIYGPSGSGKSSLAKAGLLTRLEQTGLRFAAPPWLHRSEAIRPHILSFVPGMSPVQSLAKTLAKFATDDPAPVQKSREFASELGLVNTLGQYDGLQRIAQALTDDQPLLLLVDQCEEVYSLCGDELERQHFLSNLLYAAGHPSQHVSIVMTFRSDFLGATHQHPAFNRLFSQQGFLVPVMGREGLRAAITQPALQAGQSLDDAIVDRLVEQTEGRDGALPLLQFALTRIWEGLAEHKAPAQTLQEIGGVGGALAGEAQRIYDGLNRREQAIARRLFLGLVQLGEGTRDTRRRAPVDSLISAQDDPNQVRRVINQFAAPGVRLITLATVDQQETVEVTHEALFEHWQRLNHWLDKGRDDLRFQRRLDEAAQDWQNNNRAEGLLWRQPNLDLLRSYYQRAKAEMTPLQLAFFTAAQKLENRQRKLNRAALGLLLVLTAGIAGFAMMAQRSAGEARRSRQNALGRQFILQSEQLTAQKGVTTKEAGALLAVKAFQNFQDIGVEPPHETNHALYNSLLLPNRVIRGEDGSLQDIADFSSDGHQIALMGRNNTVDIWDLSTQQRFVQLPHEQGVTQVAFSPDDDQLVTVGEDAMVRLWAIDSKTLIAQLPQISPVSDVAFSPDGKTLAIATNGPTVTLWNLSSPTTIQQLSIPAPVSQVLFSPDGTQLATAGMGGKIQLWDLSTSASIATFDTGSTINQLAWSADSRQLAAAGADGQLQVWGRDTKTLSVSLPHEGSVLSLAFSPEGERLISSSTDETTYIWNLKDQEVVASLPSDTWVKNVAFGPDGTRVAMVNAENVARLWNLDAWTAETPFRHDASLYALDVSPNGQYLATAGSDGNAHIWNLPTGQVVQVLRHEANLFGIAFSPDGKQVATASADQTAKVWEVATGEMVATFEHPAWVFDVDFSPNGQQLATASAGDQTTARLWTIQTGTLDVALPSQGTFYAIEFSPKGDALALGGTNGTEIWDVQTSELSWSSSNIGSTIGVTFNSDGSRLATGHDDFLGRIWDVKTGKLLQTLKHDDTVLGVSFSSDDSQVATASDDQTARIWDVQSGTPITSLPHEGQVVETTFSADDSQLFTVSLDGSARLWSYKPSAELADEVCQRLNRNLTAQEWERYLESPLNEYELICQHLPAHPSVLEQAKELALAGDRTAAIALYRHALKLDPNIDLDPSTETLDQNPKSLIQDIEQQATSNLPDGPER